MKTTNFKRTISVTLVMTILFSCLVFSNFVSVQAVDDFNWNDYVLSESLNPYTPTPGGSITNYSTNFRIISNSNNFQSAGDDSLKFKYFGFIQRTNDSQGDFTLKVSDNMVVSVGIVIHNDTYASNGYTFKFEAKSDTSDWTALSDNDVLSTVVGANTTAGFSNFTYTAKRLPAETTQLRFSVNGSAWWTPLINFIDIYKAKLDLSNYVINPNDTLNFNTLTSPRIDTYTNFATVSNAAFQDGAGLQKLSGNGTQNGVLTLNVNDDMTVEVGALVYFNLISGTAYKFETYNGSDWVALDDKYVLPSIGTQVANYIPVKVTASNFPAGTTKLRFTVMGSQWWDPFIDYVKFYRPNVDYNKYTLSDDLPFVNMQSSRLMSYTNFLPSMGYYITATDGVGLRKNNNDVSDGILKFKVNDDMVVKIGVIAMTSNFSATSYRFETSADGSQWATLTDEHVIYNVRQPEHGTNGYDYTPYEVTAKDFPSGTTQLKVTVISSWWDPIIDYAKFYSPVVDISKYNLTDDLAFNILESPRIVSYTNFNANAAYSIPYTDGVGLQKISTNDPADGVITFNVTDNMKVKLSIICFATNYSAATYKFEASSDGSQWTTIADKYISQDIKASVLSTNSYYYIPYDVIVSSLPAGTTQLRAILKTTPGSWWDPIVDCAKFYSPIRVSFNEYKISNDGKNIITNIQPNATVGSFLADMTVGAGTLVFKDKYENPLNNSVSSTDPVGTGTTIDVTEGSELTSYTMVIYGDITGDGLVALGDLVQIRDYLLETEEFNEIEKLAGDLYGEGDITLNDLAGVMDCITSQIAINQNR